MKPFIGVCTNHSFDPNIGLISGLGMNGQEWHMIAEDYMHAIELAGGVPVILPVTSDEQISRLLLQKLDGILLTGGSDIDPRYYDELPSHELGSINPKRDKHEVSLAKLTLFHTELPILGICRGMQILNIVAGGKLYQDLKTERPGGINHYRKSSIKSQTVHPIEIKSNTKLREIFQVKDKQVNSFNHQAVKEVGKNFIVSAKAPDGLIEAIELDGDRFVCGVQWHPEVLVETCRKSLKLFEAFIKSCQNNIESEKI